MPEKKYYDRNRKYPPILPGSKDWPVVQLSKNRKKYVSEVAHESLERLKKALPGSTMLIEELETTLYKERLRITQNKWKVDPSDDAAFWDKIKKKLVDVSAKGDTQGAEKLLSAIVRRYAGEISGRFRRSHYKLARRIITFGFAKLLSVSRLKNPWTIFMGNELSLQDKIHIDGEIGQLRTLAKKGTIVLVPTHFSNMDPILLGWIIHTLGLPPFIYGANLNLFNIKLLSYFLNSLGAYKVDRRKKNTIYQETLRTYSSLAMRKGCHSLFFPAGQRSKSGKMERRLKLGLLGTAMEAQRMIYQENGNDKKKLFIVPVVLNYNFVLEAPVLIDEYLKLKGQERYYSEDDEYSYSFTIVKFLIRFFTRGGDVSVSIGKAMDVLGNYVNDDGQSIDKHNRCVNTRDYFISDGKIVADKQREMEYTKMLSECVVNEYARINCILVGQLVAFLAFEILKKRFKKLDLYNLLRIPEEEQVIDYEEFKTCFAKLRNVLKEKQAQGVVDIEKVFNDKQKTDDQLIAYGIENVGMFHNKRPVFINKKGDVTTKDINTLFYYHNRLEGYELEKYV